MPQNNSSSAGFNTASGAPSKKAVEEFFGAIARGDDTAVREMLDFLPVLLEWKDPTRGATPLVMAARAGCTPMLDLLLEAGANPLAEDNAGMNALVNAASEGQQAACFYLMGKGFDPAKGNRSGMSAISAARAADFPGLAESLAREAPLHREESKAAWRDADVNVSTCQPVAPLKRISFKSK